LAQQARPVKGRAFSKLDRHPQPDTDDLLTWMRRIIGKMPSSKVKDMNMAGRLVLLSALAMSLAQNISSAAPLNDQPLHVVTGERPPYGFTTASGEVAGINAEIVRKVLGLSALQGSIQIYPWARAIRMAHTQPNTLIFSLSRSRERENQFIWIGKLPQQPSQFYRATGRLSIHPASLDDIRAHYSVCVIHKDIAEDDLMRKGFIMGKNYLATASFEDCMKLVQNGSVPLLISSPLDISWALKKHREIHSTFEPVLPLEQSKDEPAYLAASLGTDPKIIKRLRSAFQALQQTGRLEQVRSSFLGN
jgi:polar amino acid transport system substrate-binding protein